MWTAACGKQGQSATSAKLFESRSGLQGDCLRLLQDIETDLDGRRLEGARAPTTELALHLACLRRHPEIGAVAHTHPIHASMFAACQQTIACAIEEPLLYLGGDVLVAPYHRTGTEALGEAVAALLADRAAALLANHGLVVVATDPAEAIELTKLVERTAQVMAGAERMGTPIPLPEAIRAEFRSAYLAKRRSGMGWLGSDPRLADAPAVEPVEPSD